MEDADAPGAGRPGTDRAASSHHAAVARLAMLALQHDTSLDELVRTSLDELLRLLPATSAAVLMVDEDMLEVRVATDHRLEGERHPLAGTLSELALDAGELVAVNVEGSTELPRFVLADSGPAGPAWAIPLGVYADERVLTCIGHPDARRNPDAGPTFEAVATILSGAAERRAIEVELRSTEERFRRLAEHVPDAVFRMRIHPIRRTEYVNPRLVELTGMTEEELLSDPWAWRRIVPAEDRPALAPAYELAGTGVVTTAPYRLVRPDGTTRWVETRVAPERDPGGRLIAISGITRDITARRDAEATLRRTLEREQQAADRLRDLSELKNALMAAVSHELRTPLTAVIGFAEVLRITGETLDPARRERALAALERNARRLERLLQDLLDLDRLDRGVVEPVRRPVDIAQVVSSVIEGLDAGPIPVTVDVAHRIVDVDAAKIERVVENLVVNAIKHTPPGSQVWIRAHDTDDGLALSVEDDGPGVPDAFKSLVFEPFERGEMISPAPGTGIGLSLVRRFVELHGGRAWVEDRLGGGSAFVVWLPDRPPEDDSAA